MSCYVAHYCLVRFRAFLFVIVVVVVVVVVVLLVDAVVVGLVFGWRNSFPKLVPMLLLRCLGILFASY